ncbi:hypothetical protein [Otoolea muris]|uniref:hypothetical protein n=1 Tax=Otoolea muris TaxID=2941515 RepID=UPI00203C45C5|nr:hypothetical protein [Otoolea muris]
MKTLFVFFYIILLSAFLAVFFKRKMEETAAVSVFVTIAVLYAAGLVSGNLLWGVYVCLGLEGACAFYLTGKWFRAQEEVRAYCFTPGLMIYFALFAWIWWINRYRLFSSWDEFSHWGLVVKNMDYFNAFGNCPGSTVLCKGYPPGMALWEYFIGKLYGGFFEGHVYQARGWLLAVLFLPIAKSFTWRQCIYAGMSVIFILMCPFIFNESYLTTLYVDAVLGILFGYILSVGFLEKERNCFFILNVSLALYVLCLTKASGVFLAAVAAAVILADDWIEKNREFRKSILIWTGLCGGIAIGKFSWAFYLKASATQEAWNTSHVTIPNIIKLVNGEGAEYQYTVINNFINALTGETISGYIIRLNYIVWATIMIITMLLLGKKLENRMKRKLLIYGCTSMAGLFLYTTGLLFLYIFTYSEYEAVHLASFQRYISTYFIGVALFLASVFWGCIQPLYKYNKVFHVGLACCVLALFVPAWAVFGVTILNRTHVKSTIGQRGAYGEIYRYLRGMDYKDDKIHFIAQETNGFERRIFGYIVTPVSLGNLGMSMGKPYYDGDIWTIDYSLEEWKRALDEQDYTYVYLFKIDDVFRERYGGAFYSQDEIRQGGFYRIKKKGEDLYLELIP